MTTNVKATPASVQARYAAMLTPTPKPAEVLPLELQALLLFGRAGAGKSGIAAQIEGHLYLDFERSATSLAINEPPEGRPRTWLSFVELVNAIEAMAKVGPLPFKTLVLDTVTDAWRLCRMHILAQRKLTAEPPNDYGKTRGAMRDEFIRQLERLLTLQADGKLGLVWIAHEKETEHAVSEQESVLAADPDAKDKELASWLESKVQLAFRVRKMSANPLTGEVFRDDRGVPMVKHVVECNSQAVGSMVKDRSRRMPTWVSASWGALSSAYAKGQEAPASPSADNEVAPAAKQKED